MVLLPLPRWGLGLRLRLGLSGALNDLAQEIHLVIADRQPGFISCENAEHPSALGFGDGAHVHRRPPPIATFRIAHRLGPRTRSNSCATSICPLAISVA